MDCFESYLFDRITDLKARINEEENSVSEVSEDVQKSVLWTLNNMLEEVMEILANYTLNYKYEIGA